MTSGSKFYKCFIRSDFFHVMIRVGKEVDLHYNHQQKYHKKKQEQRKFKKVNNYMSHTI